MKYKSNATFDCTDLKDPQFYQSKENSTAPKMYEGNEKNVKIEEGVLTLNDLSTFRAFNQFLINFDSILN